MNLYKLNDYELIYLIRENNEVALNLLFEKYKALIFSKINHFKIHGLLREEFYSEGLMAVYDAIKSYRANSTITFYKYVEIIITRRFIKVYRGINTREIMVEDIEHYAERYQICDNEIAYGIDYYQMGYNLMKNDFDRLVYEGLYKHGMSPAEIANIYNINIKRIYNTIQKIKNILKELNID